MTILYRLFMALAVILPAALSAQTTWYVRADGGALSSTARIAAAKNNATVLTQCDGKTDAPYAGSTGGHCALNDWRWLYDDQVTYNTLKWVIAGGDTVIVDNTKQWRVGWDSDLSRIGNSYEPWCSGGSNYGCFNPSIPSGTPAQPTRILGRNYAACSSGNAEDKTKMSQLFSGHGAYATLNLNGAHDVQVECLELTRHSSCVVHGSPLANDCHIPTADGGIQDYDSDGIITDTGTANILLQDIWDHGHTDRGIIGPIGGLVTANRVNIDTNGMAGWDFDNGSSTPLVNASLVMHYSTIQFSGCNQEYPLVDKIPVAACYDNLSGGYGDGTGTPYGSGLNVSIDHSLIQYNTQDGVDFGHVDTGSFTLYVANNRFIGNMGGNPKWGPAFTAATVVNNLIETNCVRMKDPMTGAPSTYNQYLSSFCRSGDGVSFVSFNNETVNFAGNTIVSTAPTTIDFKCGTQDGVENCANTIYNITDNIFRLYDDPGTYSLGGQGGGPGMYCGAGCNDGTKPIGTINRLNNTYYGFRGGCMANTNSYQATGVATGEKCVDPGFVGEPAAFTREAALDNYNFNLAAASPELGAGVTFAGLLTDYYGVLRSAPPSIGAIDSVISSTATPAPAPTPVPAPTPTPVATPPPTSGCVLAVYTTLVLGVNTYKLGPCQ